MTSPIKVSESAEISEKLLSDLKTERSGKSDFHISEKSGKSGKDSLWKPPINISYETVCLANTESNQQLRPAGFRTDGKFRQIKATSMMAKVRARCMIRKQNPKMAICVTMYNEDETELRNTLRGLIQNYNTLKTNPKTNFSKDDFVVTVVCDGYDKMPESFK